MTYVCKVRTTLTILQGNYGITLFGFFVSFLIPRKPRMKGWKRRRVEPSPQLTVGAYRQHVLIQLQIQCMGNPKYFRTNVLGNLIVGSIALSLPAMHAVNS